MKVVGSRGEQVVRSGKLCRRLDPRRCSSVSFESFRAVEDFNLTPLEGDSA